MRLPTAEHRCYFPTVKQINNHVFKAKRRLEKTSNYNNNNNNNSNGNVRVEIERDIREWIGGDSDPDLYAGSEEEGEEATTAVKAIQHGEK